MTSRSLRELARVYVILLACALGVVRAGSIEVRSPSAKLLQVAPGKIVTASVVLANRGTQTDEVVERLELPPGCQRVAPPDLPVRLKPGGQLIRVLAVLVSGTAP